MFFFTWNRIFLDPYNLGSPHIWAIKLSGAIDICQTISLMWRHCNGMLQILFIVFQNFNKKVVYNSKSIHNSSKTFFNLIPKSIFKFLKIWKNLKRGIVFPKSWLFVTLPYDSLQFQKQLMTKFETHFGFKPLGNH